MTAAFADTATGWGTAQGGTAVGDDGGAGPTIIGLAETADAAGSASASRTQVTVRPITAAAACKANAVQVSSLGVRRLLHAGMPTSGSLSHASTPVRRPVHAYP